MNNALDQIINHLEFLGYSIEKIEPTKEGEKLTIIARHQQNNNFTFFEILPGFIFFKTGLTTTKKPTIEMDQYMNTANENFTLTKVYRRSENDLAIIQFEAIFIGDYTKERFAQFYNLVFAEQNKFNTFENFSKIFIED